MCPSTLAWQEQAIAQLHAVQCIQPGSACLGYALTHAFCLVEADELMVVDPSLQEEGTAAGLTTVIMNAFGELCAVQKTSGIGLPASEVQPSPDTASACLCLGLSGL